MKKIILAASLLLISSTSQAGMKIERLYTEYDYAQVIVTYINSSQNTYKKVRIKCKATNAAGDIVGINDRSFRERDEGPMGPGFSGTLEIGINLNGADYNAANCEVREM